MKHAAKTGKVFHMWWHPHNIGTNQDINFNQLESLFKYYLFLKEKYGFLSCNMADMTDELSDIKTEKV